jgi:hypothetical protein
MQALFEEPSQAPPQFLGLDLFGMKFGEGLFQEIGGLFSRPFIQIFQLFEDLKGQIDADRHVFEPGTEGKKFFRGEALQAPIESLQVVFHGPFINKGKAYEKRL